LISISPTDVDRFLAEDDGEPVIMLNLLSFQPDGGRDRYFEYLGMAGHVVARYGAQMVFAGDGLTALAAEPGQAWDAVVLVRYPSRRTFVDMIADPDYEAADRIRASALAEAVLQPIHSTSS
jgi:uncharacterized protein (DUF1330 family)